MYRDFGMTLAAKRKEKHLNQLQLTDLLNKKGLEVKPGSISKWEKNVNSPNVIQFFALCEILGIDNINDTFGIAIEENLFAQLNEEGQKKAIEYMNLLIKSGMYVREEPVYITSRTLKVFTEPASSGTGLFLDSDQYEEFEVGNDVPATADFGICVSGDSMEPVYVNKQIVWVYQQDQLENGDIGIFYLNGDAYIICSYPDQTRNGASNLRKGRKINVRLVPALEITSITASAFSFCSLTHTRTHLPQAYRNIWRYETTPHKMLSSAFAQFFQSCPYWFPPAKPADPVSVPHRYEAFLNSSGTPSQHITIPLLF